MKHFAEGGLGRQNRTIHGSLAKLPKEFSANMQSLMRTMRHSKDAGSYLNENQREFFNTYKRVLGQFVKNYGDAPSIMASKRRYLSKKMPMAQAFGRAYMENPDVFQRFLKNMKMCSK